MKIFHLNYSDISGGAARAAYRIHHALRGQGIDSWMKVNSSEANDWTVEAPETQWGRFCTRAKPAISGLFLKLARPSNVRDTSIAILPSGRPKHLNRSDADLLHLHWVTGEMLSIADIGKLQKPLVWTMHDMWPFCGAEHYTADHRWVEGYSANNRPSLETGFDINRWVWERKLRHWSHPISIVAPSRWMADCVKKSALMKNWPLTVIPNCLDTELWRPVDKTVARKILGLPADVPLLLFGAIRGSSDPRKGFDLLRCSLRELQGEFSGLELVIFGQSSPEFAPDLGFPVHYAGHLHDSVSLVLLYSAANAIIVPSRLESFGQTASEAHACGTPVVAFDVGGLADIVEHKKTGYLSRPFDTKDLASGIRWVLSHNNQKSLGQNARSRALTLFSSTVIAKRYSEVYGAAVGR